MSHLMVMLLLSFVAGAANGAVIALVVAREIRLYRSARGETLDFTRKRVGA